jgi:hypothetical protein
VGTLHHFSAWLPHGKKKYGIKSFVETGTGMGVSLSLAVALDFDQVHTIEIVPELVALSRMKYASNAKVHIHEGDSRVLLEPILRELPKEPALFWLDAHFPGSDSGMVDYEAEPDIAKRLPLREEINLIHALRSDCLDVLLIDDARLFQPEYDGRVDQYVSGLWKDWAPVQGSDRSAAFIREAYGKTHGIVCDFADQHYWMIIPKQLEPVEVPA